MEYQFKYDEGAKELIFYQLQEFDDSASVESYESIDRVHPDSSYFYFSFPVDNLKKWTGYYENETSKMKIFPKEDELSIKIVKTHEYVFKLDLPETTFEKVKEALDSASTKPSGGKTRRRKTFSVRALKK
jgi:hypothetical protein